jgi:iron(III) transport system substrate-binding protein
VTPDVAARWFDTFAPVSSNGLPAEFIGPDGVVRAPSAAAFGFMYNTNLMSEAEAPKGWQDLTDPVYRGRMTLEDPRRFSGAFSAFSHLLWDGRYDATYIDALAPQEMVYQAMGPVAGNAVATGEFALDPAYTLALYQKVKQQGAPVEFVFPTEGGAHLSPNYLALVRGAPNPDAARLLMAWLFTPEAQAATADVGWYPLMPGAAGPEGFPAAAELDLLRPFPLDQVGQIAQENLAVIQESLG